MLESLIKRNLKKGEKYLGVRDTRRALTEAQYKTGGPGDYAVFIKYKGKWLRLGTVDDCEEVYGYVCEDKVGKEEIKNWKREILFGAKVTKTAFFMIDSATDG